MAIDGKTFQIKIESILGGQSAFTHYAADDEFADSFGIDPSIRIDDSINGSTGSASVAPTGLLRPSTLTVVNPVTSVAAAANFLWIEQAPSDGGVWAYMSTGSAYTLNTTSQARSFTALSDTGALSNSSGNGMSYYDGYIYFAKDTDIARYNISSGAWDGSYWQGTLSKAALTNTSYPGNSVNVLPNHVMHRHSDGKLYIADVSGGNGVIHVISTSSGTDNGSTFAKLTFGSGLWPTAIESYGSSLAIALYEGPSPSLGAVKHPKRAKLAFWDTISQNFNLITWVEFPDELITGIKNVDGTLYIASTSASAQYGNPGVRISEYIGGYSVRDVAIRPDLISPLMGGMDGDSNRLVIATATYGPLNSGAPRACLYSFGLGLAGTTGRGFNLGGSLDTDTTSYGAALLLSGELGSTARKGFYFSYYSGTTINCIITNSAIIGGQTNYSLYTRKIKFREFNIGQPFKITKIRFPFAQAVGSNSIVTPIIYTDKGAGTTYTGGTAPGLAIINSSNYLNRRSVVMRPQNLTGDHTMQLELQWTGTALFVMSLPIIIEYELLDD